LVGRWREGGALLAFEYSGFCSFRRFFILFSWLLDVEGKVGEANGFGFYVMWRCLRGCV